MSDNGPQYASEEFREFSRQWNFRHVTSSPTYPQSNGKAEAAVKTAKAVMKKAKKARTDPYLALLAYRNTPTQGLETSPVMRLMSRRTRTRLPTMPELLKPVVNKNTYEKILKNKEKQASLYNRGAKDLEELVSGDTVRLIPPGTSNQQAVRARVNKQVGSRSYEVVTEDGAVYRRNRRHLRKTKETYSRNCPSFSTVVPPEPSPSSTTNVSPEVAVSSLSTTPPVQESCVATTVPTTLSPQQPPVRVTRSGRQVKKPKYLNDYLTN